MVNVIKKCCFLCAIYFFLPGYTAMGYDACNKADKQDSLVTAIEDAFWDSFGPMALKNTAGMDIADGLDTQFLKTFKRGDRLPEEAVKYIDVALAANRIKNLSPVDRGYWLFNLLAILRFIETGDPRLAFLILTMDEYFEINVSKYLNRKSPMYVFCARKTIVERMILLLEKLTPDSTLNDSKTPEHPASFAIDSLNNTFYSLAEYNQKTGDTTFSKEFMFNTWLFMHAILFNESHAKLVKWSALAQNISWDSLGAYGKTPGRLWPMLRTFNRAFKGTGYEKVIKKLLNDEQEWHGFLKCAAFAQKIEKSQVNQNSNRGKR